MIAESLINARLNCPGHSTNNIIRHSLLSLSSGLKKMISITWKDSPTVKGLNCRKAFLMFPIELFETAEVP